MSVQFRETLYHGTIAVIELVIVSEGRGNKDFGKGFYMAVSKSQAIGIMHKKYREAVRRSRNKKDALFHEHLYRITIDTEVAKKLNNRIFEDADMQWLEFVLNCREHTDKPHGYDLVVGPTADDDTLFCLKNYWDGVYGTVGSEDAKRLLMKNLEPENLGVQYYIGDQEIADRLIIRIEEIDWSTP